MVEHRASPIIREASVADGAAGIEVLRRSIKELCESDHNGDPDMLAAWLSNKTIESWAAWVASNLTALLVAELDGGVAGVGMLGACQLMLLYVSPQYRFRGVSKSLLRSLEEAARSRGCQSIELESTETAYQFYLEHGYSRAKTVNHLTLSKSLD